MRGQQPTIEEMPTMNIQKITATLPVRPQAKSAPSEVIFVLLTLFFGALVGSVVVFANEPLYIMGVLGGIIVFLLSLYSEEFGLLVLIFISYSRFSDVLIEYHGFISFAKPFLAVLILTIFVRWGVFGVRPKGWERPLILFGLLSLTGLFSSFYSPAPDRVWDRLIDDFKDIIIAIVVVILLQQGPSFRRVLWTLMWVGFFLGTLTVFQYATRTFDHVYGGFAISQEHQIIGSIDDYRSTGPIGDPNFFAQVMVVLVPISYERFLHEKRTILRFIALYICAVSVISVILTYSRGGLLALLAGLLLLLLYYPPRRFQIALIFISTFVIITLLPPNYVNRLFALTELFQPRDSLRVNEQSLQGRLSENLTALEMIKSNPLFGIGLSSFRYLYPQYSRKLGLALVATERDAHNLYLEVAAETGIIGFLMFALVLFACFQTLFSARRLFLRMGLKDYGGMVTGFMAGWVGYLVAALYIQNAFPRYLYLLMGIALSLRMIAQNTALTKMGAEGGV